MSFTLSTGNVVVASASGAVQSQTDTTATIRITASAYITDGWVYSTGVVARITVNGTTYADVTMFGNATGYWYGTSGTKVITKDVSISKGTAAKNISWKVVFLQATDGVIQYEKQTNTGTVAVSAKTSYMVSFSNNGGTGAPAGQTKWYGTNLTLSSTKPTRTGYTFLGWGTSASATTATYQPGGTYTANASATLYALWKINTWTVSYNANGGSGAPAAQTKTYGYNLTLSSTKPTRTNYTFQGWGTSASATTVAYAAGATYTANAAITLYAVWALAYQKPTISNLTVQRCTSDGTLDSFGTYVKVTFDWSCSQLAGTNNVSSITFGRKLTTETSYTTGTLTANGTTSGTVSQICGAGALSAEYEYDIQIIVTDSKGGSTTADRTIPTAAYTIDFLAGGKGVAIGKAATTENLFDVALPASFDKVNDMQLAPSGGSFVDGMTATSGVIVGSPQVGTSGSIYHPIIRQTTGSGHVVNIGGIDNLFGITGFYSGRTANGYDWRTMWNASNGHLHHSKTLEIDGTITSGGKITAPSMALTGTGDASGTAAGSPPLTIGTATGEHIAIDMNEIMAKASATTTGTLYVNTDGGKVAICNNLAAASTNTSLSVNGNAQFNGTILDGNGRNINTNIILWSGTYFMTAGHTITLNASVVAQPHGIVLAWSAYNGSAAENHSWSYTFVPKSHVMRQPGTSLFCSMNCLGGGVMASKCVYVNSTTITGHDMNGYEGTDCSVNYYNTFYVLRYVIGV